MRDSFTKGIATILWGIAWADHADGHRCCSLSGCEITEVMPEIPNVAWEAASYIVGKFEQANGACWASLFAQAMRADGLKDWSYHGRDAERFGECVFYMCAGHGVSWFDVHKAFVLNTTVHIDTAENAVREHADTACKDRTDYVRCPNCGDYVKVGGDHCPNCSSKGPFEHEDEDE